MGRAAPFFLPFISILSTAYGGVDFQKDIAPIFAEYCLECHGPDKVKGGLNLASRDGILKELESGNVAIKSGKPEESALLARLLSTDDEEIMPPRKKEKRPKPEEIERLKLWISEG